MSDKDYVVTDEEDSEADERSEDDDESTGDDDQQRTKGRVAGTKFLLVKRTGHKTWLFHLIWDSPR